MIRKKTIPEEDSSFPLLRLLNAGFPERYKIAERIARREVPLAWAAGRSSRMARVKQWKRRAAPKFDYYVLTGKWPSGPRIFVFPRLWWERLMRWTPSRGQIDLIGDVAWLFGNALKLAVVGAGLYVLGEVVWAFLPGGAAWRVVEGLR